jgi:hypothetical protein
MEEPNVIEEWIDFAICQAASRQPGCEDGLAESATDKGVLPDLRLFLRFQRYS